MIKALLGGLISTLSPSVILMILAIAVIFEKLIKGSPSYWLKFLLFILSFFVMQFFLSWAISNWSTENMLPKAMAFGSMMEGIFLIFLLWFLGLGSRVKNTISEKNQDFIFSLLGPMILGIKLSLSCLQSLGPIIGTLMIEKSMSGSTENVLFYYSIGLILPIGFLIVLLEPFYGRLRQKDWWILFRSLVGVLLLINSIAKILRLAI